MVMMDKICQASVTQTTIVYSTYYTHIVYERFKVVCVKKDVLTSIFPSVTSCYFSIGGFHALA